MFLIRCNFNNVHNSIQSFFELRNGQLTLEFTREGEQIFVAGFTPVL